jgi:hypothetical protein
MSTLKVILYLVNLWKVREITPSHVLYVYSPNRCTSDASPFARCRRRSCDRRRRQRDARTLAHALANLSQHDRAEGWAVKRSSDFVNEYPRRNTEGALSDGTSENPNHLLGTFPCLFPYGQGGFEVDRPIPVRYDAHGRWSIRYSDRRFRLDHLFIFQIFGVLQKRQLCAAAALQISKRSFLREEHAIQSLKPSDFELAAAEERARKPFSNPVIRTLRRNLSAARAKVMGTDESRIKVRSLIWGMCIKKCPPSIWLTINPADTQDPIAQVLCGQDFDLDNFTAFDEKPSSVAIAADPFASARFFHLVVQAVLQALLGIKGFHHARAVERETGVLGIVEGYIGTVEAQGRGTLHLHMVLWLKGAVTTDTMRERLSTADFREKVKRFISANIHADFSDTHGTAVLSLPQKSRVAFSRPVDPRSPDYDEKRKAAEKEIARTVQVHQCGYSCMKMMCGGRFACKRKAPFPLAADSWIDGNGRWGPRRMFGYLNNWCPEILQSIRANHDIKLITNGMETKDIVFYITNYATKKHLTSSNITPLLAKTFAFNGASAAEGRTTTLSALNKKLMQRCGNMLSREQELSAPEVISYLMDWGDRYISHHFKTIHWYKVSTLLKKTFPVLSVTR